MMHEVERLHGHLLGQQGSRLALNTPALVLDRDMLDRNIASMASLARGHGIRLRPHAKAHKSIDIARRQMAAGAIGQCCAILGEAEALAAGGIHGLLLTSPVVTPQAIARMMTLNGGTTGLLVVVDHPANVDTLAAVAERCGAILSVLVDIDPGVHRTGVADPAGVVALAADISGRRFLRYAGVQFYCGTLQHVARYSERKAAVEERTAYFQTVLADLTTAGLQTGIVTGDGTGTQEIDASQGVFNELQPGSYIFMDSQYSFCGLRDVAGPVFEQALQIDASVISANHPGMATIDAGLKAMATDSGPPSILLGAPERSTAAFMGDEHSAVLVPRGMEAPQLGDRVVLQPPHCDPTVNLHDCYHVVQDDTLVGIWPIKARGMSA